MSRSAELYALAQEYIPGGVNSPVRAYRAVGGIPPFIKAGHGAYVVDADDNEYIDYVGSWGPLITGHAHPYLLEKVREALDLGVSFGAPTEIEVKLAKKVCELMPSIEMIRFVNSGTEATMTAIRLARGYTSREKIIKFAGCYHGHADSLLVAAGSGGLTFGIPNSAGVPADIAKHTLVAQFNRLDEVEDLFKQHSSDIAGIIIEPIAGNMNCVLPAPGFLEGLRKLCDRYQSLLIIDEVMTGFRVALGGAQSIYNVTPDITVLGKVIGGGFPVAAFGGKKEIMSYLSPMGPVYQAGTLSGNPIAMTAGLANLELICAANFYENLDLVTKKIMDGLKRHAQAACIPFYTNSVGGMFGFFFTEQKQISCENDVKKCNLLLFRRFFHGMLNKGIYFAPSAFEAGFVSAAHGRQEIEQTLTAAEEVFHSLNKEGSACDELFQVRQA